MKCFNDFIVDTNVLKNNANNIKSKVGNNTKLCAVVKANAYSVGVETVCNTLKGVADFFACACLKEALSIRTFDKSTPILILGYVEVDDYNIVAENNISISLGYLEQVKNLCVVLSKKIKVHLQVNTGLNRFGFRTIKDFKQALKLIAANDLIELEGVYSHFATKQNDIQFMNRQYLRFLQFKKYVLNNNVIFHIANSYAILQSEKFHMDMVRPGFLLYGYTENNIGNKPILSIESQVISIINVKKRETIGYDRTFRTDKTTNIAIVPIGYADGFNRKLSNNFHILINDKKYCVVGRICMDVFMVDIGKDAVLVGDKVTILGKTKNQEITLNDHAERINTSPYDVICGFNYKRMNYISNNK